MISNENQFLAIKGICCQQTGISLLQGPPGTGKTFTLISILSGLYNFLRLTKSHRKHIMVCAPSNAAIDEIIKRVLENGLISENGDLIRPKIVRVGVLDHTSCQEIIDISLENQANRIFCVNKDQDILETKQDIIKITNQINKIKDKDQG